MNFDTPMVPLAFSVNEMLGTFFLYQYVFPTTVWGTLKNHQKWQKVGEIKVKKKPSPICAPRIPENPNFGYPKYPNFGYTHHYSEWLLQTIPSTFIISHWMIEMHTFEKEKNWISVKSMHLFFFISAAADFWKNYNIETKE